MTKAQWLRKLYDKPESNKTWLNIQASGWGAVPCDCRKEGCEGWRLKKVGKPRPAPVESNEAA